jgi:hypothetical protein
MDFEISNSNSSLMDVEAIQKALGRSRPSIYRYANTDTNQLNTTYDPKLLNPELRKSPNDVLKIKQVTIQVQEPAATATNQLLQEILTELRSLNQYLQNKS